MDWLVLLAMVLAVFGPFAASGSAPLLLHQISLSWPSTAYYTKCLTSGVLPLWDPYVGCGEPFLGDVQHGVLYPLYLVHLVLSPASAKALFCGAHVLLAGVGTLLLCRMWGCSRIASLLGAVAFSFGSYTITRLETNAAVASFTWYPMVLFAFLSYLRSRKLKYFVATSVAVCLQFLGGLTDATLYTIWSLLFCGLIVGWYEWKRSHKVIALLTPSVMAVAVALGSVLFAMAQFLPTCEALWYSGRPTTAGGPTPNQGLHPLAVFSLLFPSVYGTYGDYWAPTLDAYWQGALYIGIVPIVVLVQALLAKMLLRGDAEAQSTEQDAVQRGRLTLLVVLAVFFSLYSAGKFTPLYPTLYRLLPPLRMFNTPSKSLMCVASSLSCLSALGFDAARRLAQQSAQGRHARRVLLARWGGVAVFGLVSVLVGLCWLDGARLGRTILCRFFNLGADKLPGAGTVFEIVIQCLLLGVIGPLVAFLFSWCLFRGAPGRFIPWAMVVIAFVELRLSDLNLLATFPANVLESPPKCLAELRPADRVFRFATVTCPHPEWLDGLLKRAAGTPCSVDIPPDFAGVRLFRELLLVGWARVDGVFCLSPSSTFASHAFNKVFARISFPDTSNKIRLRTMGMLNCEKLLVSSEPGGSSQRNGGLRLDIATLPNTLPRAYVVGGVKVLEDEEAVLTAMFGDEDFDSLQVAFIDRAQAGGEDLATLRSGPIDHRIERLAYGCNSLDITVSSEREGVLVVSDTWFPGWTASLNGAEVPIYRVNYAFRGIHIRSGTNHVKMTYEPATLRVGAVISLTALLTSVVLVILRSLPTRLRVPSAVHAESPACPAAYPPQPAAPSRHQ